MGDRLEQRRSVVVVGEAGVGKTALLRAAATASGRRVHEGGGLATLSSLSYLPVTRALGREPRGRDHAAVAEDVVTRINGGVLMLDDLHWADVDTLAVLEYLAGSLVLLGAVRAGTPGPTVRFRTPRLRGWRSSSSRAWAPRTPPTSCS